MCHNRDFFHTFTEVDGDKVFISNDLACKTMRIVTIQLKMHDGVVCTLGNVRYVPYLKNNLISLEALDSNGYQILLKGRSLKVLFGVMDLMQGKKECNR